ncbi:ribulose-bisphosphate carboxylase large subunit family protein [Variovorax sp. Root411]|uniref:ribulose-bisphosphate carboxylase large subunit family protein n=1 Tax=Variovorax sp. Root411 TaxID=1736530 RepID=UPI0006F49F21|nr:ribulose-bisphosphate carboxylase large subunit family protein [Variovorax sp. Root411]KQW56421.1 ribulose 1,5-bisphosphate carboxylase [Variovorax sp. Root411]
MTQRFSATYLIETTSEPMRAALEMAGEQSTATTMRIAGESDAVVERHGAHIESLDELESVSTLSLPDGRASAEPVRRARVTLSWPTHNVGASLPILSTTLLGNQTGMRRLSGIRLEHLELPAAFAGQFPRPHFGVAGTRELVGVHGRPLIGSIVKPNIGLSPGETAQVARSLIEGGVDFIKDDELMANPPYCPLSERVPAVMRVIRDYTERTGRKVIYAFNISDETDEMKRHHDLVLAEGGNCIMVNLNSVGLAAVQSLRRHSQLPIHGHRAGWAMLTRHALLGMNFQPYQALFRLAGVDQLHVSGLGGKFWESADDILQSARDCLTPLVRSLQGTPEPRDAQNDDRTMPVFSGGSTIHEAAPTFVGAGTTDLIYACGGAIFGHPDGIAAGCRSIREAWEAAIAGVALPDYAAQEGHGALAAALAHRPVRKVAA